ncbi:MAG TPA: serine/threonine-protein kinase [Trichormus sp.]|jgi:serine/threonine-protein kinase
MTQEPPAGFTQRVNIEKKYCPKCYQQFEGNIPVCPDDGALLRGAKNDPLIGKVFADKYEVNSVLGLGGMSIVYKALHKLMDRNVAIKMLHKNLKEDIVALERFRLEARAASLLSHQNIIAVYDFGVTNDGEPYFVMDCLEGESLKELIERKGRVPFDRALPIFRQICDGLEAAHKKGVVHRDLKPANVCLIKEDDGSELVKLVDFGIAKLLPQSGKEQQHLTQTGEVFGSPIYMSPEQCLGKDLDTRSDIYALGCLMYETLTGDPPFIGDSFLETMNKHVGEEAKSIRKAFPDANVPEDLDQLILQCMSKKPENRYQSAGEIRDMISGIIVNTLGNSGRRPGSISTATATTTAMAPCPEIEKQKRKSSVAMVIASVAVAGLLGFVGFCAFWPGPPDDLGTPMQKLTWQVQLGNADAAMKNKDFTRAYNILKDAEARARAFGDGHARLAETLRREVDLYTNWEGHADDLEKTNTEINTLEAEQIKREFKREIVRLNALSTTDASNVGRANAKLIAEAQLATIVSTGNKLMGRTLFPEMEQLLRTAIQKYERLLGKDSIAVAQLDAKLAEGLIAERKIPEVRPLLLNARRIYKQTASDNPVEYVRVLNKLGQFDLDQSDFSNAKQELTEALDMARKLPNHKELLVLCLRNKANLLEQCGEPGGEAKNLIKEADQIERQEAAHN